MSEGKLEGKSNICRKRNFYLEECIFEQFQDLLGVFHTNNFIDDFFVLDFRFDCRRSHLVDQLWQKLLESLEKSSKIACLSSGKLFWVFTEI